MGFSVPGEELAQAIPEMSGGKKRLSIDLGGGLSASIEPHVAAERWADGHGSKDDLFLRFRND
jgi:hypothetical protein